MIKYQMNKPTDLLSFFMARAVGDLWVGCAWARSNNTEAGPECQCILIVVVIPEAALIQRFVRLSAFMSNYYVSFRLL